MVFRDKLIQEIESQERIPDGMGGFISQEPVRKEIRCKASLNTSPEIASAEIANAYGTNGEQVLYVVAQEKLNKEAFYFFDNLKYTIRAQTNNNRLYYSTLVEVK